MTPREELAKLNLKSAFRRRGCHVADPVEVIAVAVAWGPNKMTLRVAGGKWSREDSAAPGRLVAVGDVGDEDTIARWLTPELMDREKGPRYAAIG
ncbi:hypothetical protein [Nocardiopsis dassonvillei]|uniref:hypothetical protein n=1 Tax=Nocardiopsis dassonvillei TaxID=2014 RepID=UPI0033E0BABD